MKMNTEVSQELPSQHLPALLPVPGAVSARLVSYEELREAGWSKRMIIKFLGGSWRTYSLDAVEAAEAHPKFRAARARALRDRCGNA